MPPDVHSAMADNRPEKQTMRQIWVDRVAEVPDPNGSEPIYLTLAGAEGRDVKALVDAGLIRVEENGAIAEEDAHKVVAVESHEEAFLNLKKTIKGLDARRERIEDLLRKDSPFNWPQGEHRDIFRALVVNFDFDEALAVGIRNRQLVFPQLSWVRKVAEIHAHDPPLDWCLMLTFQAQIAWPAAVEKAVMRLLADNFERTESFSEAAEKLLGPDAVKAITDGSKLVLSHMDPAAQQKLLMALVPKKICQSASGQGWCIKTRTNVMYGGVRKRARMVSFMFDFTWDARSSTSPADLYRESLLDAVADPARIDAKGKLVRLP
jgi:hypothetical protein